MNVIIEEYTFQTRARTVDHLGREQIADCPTAISELWKNAFDAYARNVELNIYGGVEPIAAITDDGHGMTREEFTRSWLVVGTESKTKLDQKRVGDRNGLRPRPIQGQKGIGRLSCANLGPILLLVSKRRQSPFVAALVDWRLFENPFMNLSDIQIPVVEFTKLDDLFGQLPNLAASLSENVTGGSDDARKLRIREAWSAADNLWNDKDRDDDARRISSRNISSAISHTRFERRHLRQWSVAKGDSDHGTALVVSGINYDLRVHLDESIADFSARSAKDRFFETLSSFVDPFIDPADPETATNDPQFSYAVRIWTEGAPRLVVGSEKQFDKRQVDGMEHRIEGRINSDGVFIGRVKAFGELLPGDCIIDPPKDLKIPRRRDSKVGPLDIYIASMEFTPAKTTHTPSEFRYYQDLAEKYSGFMIFRDGLRVLPYGRTDNDFFEIESRRSKSAGREFWNHRQMFGRISITREKNPNLKDKAGREGLLDNRAAKTLKGLIANILMQSARQYFGSASKLRKELLPQVFAENERMRAVEARSRLRKRQREEFRSKLQRFNRGLPCLAREIEHYQKNLRIENEVQISEAQHNLDAFRERAYDYMLPGVPKDIGVPEDAYAEYQSTIQSIYTQIAEIGEIIQQRIEQMSFIEPVALLEKQLSNQTAQIHRRIKRWSTTIDTLQKAEYRRIREVAAHRSKQFRAEALPLVHRLKGGNMSYIDACNAMNAVKQRLDEENQDLFVSYIRILEILQESINLEHLATYTMEQTSNLRAEVERLNGLAQLGIAVEIVGHELQAYDDIIGLGLKRLPVEIREGEAAKDIEFGYEGLTDQLRFLSPLRLAGQKVQRWITGSEIFNYVMEFFRFILSRERVSLTATTKFLCFRVFDQRSRLYPVFINLLNNSIYWLSTSDLNDRQVVFDVVNSEIVVSDNGPGVDQEDVSSLFNIFFTKKLRGGRGVGLYLCRANLVAGGHQIRYEASTTNMPLKGANFVITFRGGEFDDG